MWERAYLAFSTKLHDSLPPRQSAIEGYLENNVAPLVDALEDLLEPSDEDHECFAYAMELFTEYERHGYPYPGTYHDQPAQYIYVLDSIRSAKDAAEGYERQKESYEGYLKRQEAEEKAQEPEMSADY